MDILFPIKFLQNSYFYVYLYKWTRNTVPMGLLFPNYLSQLLCTPCQGLPIPTPFILQHITMPTSIFQKKKQHILNKQDGLSKMDKLANPESKQPN